MGFFRSIDTERRGRVVWAVTTLALVALVVGLGFQLTGQRRFAEDEVQQRFHDRAAQAAEYVEVHLEDMRTRQLDYARSELAGDEVTGEQFDVAATAFGFEAAILLDEEGRVLAASPDDPSLLGQEVASRYEHLESAVAGSPAVSGVVLSAVDQEPIVAVAAPFATASGRRVISGGYELAGSPLAAFLSSMSTLRGREVYLVDGDGQVVAATEAVSDRHFDEHAPDLAAVEADQGDVDYDGVPYRYVREPIEGTDWDLVAVAPRAQILSSITYQDSAARILLAAAALLAAAVSELFHRTLRQRSRLDHLSRTDALTGLPNRGQADAVIARAAATSERTGRPWAIAVIDADHFKAINDRLGHPAGDRTLRHLAAVMKQQTRTSDVIGRWGGEEFVLIMEDTDTIAAVTAAERMVAAVRENVSADGRPVTVSIGVAAGTAVPAETMLNDADAALYRAKAEGRDRVEMVLPADITGLLDDSHPGFPEPFGPTPEP